MSVYDDMITIGVVVKPQGRKGEVLVEPLSDRPDRFTTLQRVYVPVPGSSGARAVSVTHRWPHKGRIVLKFAGVDSIDEAEARHAKKQRHQSAATPSKIAACSSSGIPIDPSRSSIPRSIRGSSARSATARTWS